MEKKVWKNRLYKEIESRLIKLSEKGYAVNAVILSPEAYKQLLEETMFTVLSPYSSKVGTFLGLRVIVDYNQEESFRLVNVYGEEVE